jgi:leucine dehydrogenase
MKYLTDQIVRNERIFNTFLQLRYGDLHFKRDESSGLLAIIAIHSTFNGLSLGGCRYLPYDNFEDAIIDALRLANAMSYKAAVANLPIGGGKAVIMKHPGITDEGKLFHAFGEFVHSLNGRYITAEDSGTSVKEMDIIRAQTPFVTGNSAQTFICKDPSILTALGVRRGIEASVQYQLKKDSLKGIHIAIQGLGNVGFHLAKECYEHGAKLTVCDKNPEALARMKGVFKAEVAKPENIHQIACDVFAPCALSNAVNALNVNEIQASIVAGSANNQLESDHVALMLKQRGILYAPDYVINAGGLIHVCAQYFMQDELAAKEQIRNIYQTLMTIFQRAEAENLPTISIANMIAELRLYPN